MAVEYQKDVYGWSVATAEALRERRLDQVDLDAVADEVLDVGKHERHLLRAALMQVLVHLLKLRYQPGKATRSWALSVMEHRKRAELVLDDSPSLRPLCGEVLAEAYDLARVRAARQTGMAVRVFPIECEWTVDEVLRLVEPDV